MAGEPFTGAHRVALLAACGIRPGGRPDVAVTDVPVAGTQTPDMPHRLALTYPAPAPGDALDGDAEWSGLHLRIRWGPHDPVGAEHAALEARADVQHQLLCQYGPDAELLESVTITTAHVPTQCLGSHRSQR